MLRRNVEPLAARLARDRIVDPDHVIAQLGGQTPVPLVRARRDAVLLSSSARLNDLVFVDTLAARTGQPIGSRLAAIVEEVAFVERR